MKLASLMYRVIQSIIMSEEEVRLKGLDCLAKMANLSNASYDMFIDALIRCDLCFSVKTIYSCYFLVDRYFPFLTLLLIFSAIQSVQEYEDRNRVAFILRELCTRLSGETIFCSLSVKLCSLETSKKTISIVQLLNLLISTSPQLFSLRQSLQVNDKESKIFSSLWTCWTQCPISSLSLALLGKRYALAFQVN